MIIYKRNFLSGSKFILDTLNPLKKEYNIMITGGESIKLFYPFLKKVFCKLNKKINYLISDERLVKNNSLKNSTNIKNFFLYKKNYHNFIFYDLKKKNIVTNNYINLEKLDIILLTLGSDGHYASIFQDTSNKNTPQKFIITQKKSEKFRRISISPYLIKKNKNIIIVIFGKQRMEILKKNKNYKQSFLYNLIKNKKFLYIIK